MSGLRLILTRHAQSVANARGILDTRLPGSPLTGLGHHQAANLADRLDGEPVVAVYASRALRAQLTAQPVAVRRDLEVEVLNGVHEVFIGDLDGRSGVEDHEALHAVYHAWYSGDLHVRLPGGESGKDVLDRYLADVAAVRAAYTEGTAVLVSHGAATRLAATALASNVAAEFAGPRLLSNTGTVVLEASRAGWRCLSWDGVELDG